MKLGSCTNLFHNNLIMSHRIVYLDGLRILACLMIVLMHAPHPDAGNPGILLTPISFLTASGIGLFFMVSGALLLPVSSDTSSFLKRRLGKIVGPLLFWTFFYMIANLLTGKMSVYDIGHAALSVLFSTQGHGVLWFLYTLAGLYLVAPVISPFLKKASERELRFYLILWLVAMCFPLLSQILEVNRSTTGLLYYFTGYLGYFVLGYYMHKYRPQLPKLVIACLFLIPVAFLGAYKYLGIDFEFFDICGYLSILIGMMCVGWFYSAQRLNMCTEVGGANLMAEISNCCFGIYLMHIFIMRYLLWHIDFIVFEYGGIGQILLTWLLTFVISLVLTYLISYLPFAEFIVGYKHKR